MYPTIKLGMKDFGNKTHRTMYALCQFPIVRQTGITFNI